MHVFMSPCSALKPSCEDILYKKATWLFLLFLNAQVLRQLTSLLYSSEDQQKVSLFLSYLGLHCRYEASKGQYECVWLKLLTPGGGGVKLAKNTKSWKGPVMGRRDRPVVSLLTGEKTL